jgi:hypothetical protein
MRGGEKNRKGNLSGSTAFLMTYIFASTVVALQKKDALKCASIC